MENMIRHWKGRLIEEILEFIETEETTYTTTRKELEKMTFEKLKTLQAERGWK